MRLTLMLTLLAAPALVSADPPWKGKDLQILPKDISKEKIKEIVLFSVSEQYFRLREALGTQIKIG